MSRIHQKPSRDDNYVLVRETKDVQNSVGSALGQYLELSDQMREFEDAFSRRVLDAANELFMLRTQRKRLEEALNRIKEKKEAGGYATREEIADDVEEALSLPELKFPDEAPEPPSAEHGELDGATKDRIYRAFKRVVLPRLHPDTSDADSSEFEVAYAAYKSNDYVLMEAFVIQYTDNLDIEEDGNLLTRTQLIARLNDYKAAYQRLDKRLAALRKERTSSEANSPEQARKRIEEQGEKFRRAVIEESERIRELQKWLESLTNHPYQGRV